MDLRSQTLEELEGKEWGEPPFHSSLIMECHRLRRIPLREYDAGDLRIMIGQKIGLRYLMPIALEFLSENPWICGSYFDGDLLQAVLRVEGEYWKDHLTQDDSLKLIVQHAIETKATPESLDQSDRETLELLHKWRDIHGGH